MTKAIQTFEYGVFILNGMEGGLLFFLTLAVANALATEQNFFMHSINYSLYSHWVPVLCQALCKVLSGQMLVEIRLFQRITRKAFQGPMHGRLLFGNMIYSGENRPVSFQCPISFHLAMEKDQPCLQQGQNKSQCPKFLNPHSLLWAPGSH